jgi:hypothetical protein
MAGLPLFYVATCVVKQRVLVSYPNGPQPRGVHAKTGIKFPVATS